MTPPMYWFVAALILPAVPDAQSSVDPFIFFRPSLVVTQAERQKLDTGGTLVRMLPAQRHEVAIAAAVRVEATAERLIAWIRDIADLKRSPFVQAIGRFSDPPRPEDLAGLALDDDDLERIRRCRTGDCGVKLAAFEMAQLRRAIADAHDDWRPAAQAAFRGIVLSRVRAYLADGHRGLAAMNDRDAPVALGAEFSRIVHGWPFLAERMPAFVEFLEEYPRIRAPELESFLYWSREQLGGRPIVSVTHVVIARGHSNGLPDALVAGKQVFATHYMTGSLNLTALMRESPDSPAYLVYLNRSNVDVLEGLFAGFVRLILERRLKTEASNVLQGLRQRLESGNPRSSTSLVTRPARELRVRESVAAGVSRLRVRRPRLWRSGNHESNQGGRGFRVGRVDALEPAQSIHGRGPHPVRLTWFVDLRTGVRHSRARCGRRRRHAGGPFRAIPRLAVPSARRS